MSRQSGLPAYSRLGLGNKDLFLGQRNEVLIYCEDEGWEEFYWRLLNRVPLNFTIQDVFCVGGKGEALKRLKEPEVDGKKRIILVDKDFDDLTGSVRGDPGIVYLARYSIENYFVQESLLVDFVLDSSKRSRRADVKQKLDFDEVLRRMLEWYVDLCRKFIVARKFTVGIATTKQSGRTFFAIDGTAIDAWFESYERDFRSALFEDAAWLLEEGVLEGQLASAFEPQERFKGVCDGSPHAHLCGKHLLDVFLDRCSAIFSLPKFNDVAYSFMMSAVGRVDEELPQLLRNRIHLQLDRVKD